MPYIQCKDGKTYSRYDQSEYVKKCICEEKEAQVREFQECMQDPTCKKEYEHHQYVANVVGITIVSIFLVALTIAIINLIRHETRNN